MIGEGREPEAVIPLSKLGSMGFGGGGGGNITVNVNGGDPQQVVNALRRYMQLNGSVPIRVS
jgi:phosphotransferase system HPr-like phosphotransfer protein